MSLLDILSDEKAWIGFYHRKVDPAFCHISDAQVLFKYINNGDHVYFVHSFYAADCAKDTIAVSEYGAPLTAAVAKDNVYGCQFHPEKSGEVGMNILKAFCEL